MYSEILRNEWGKYPFFVAENDVVVEVSEQFIDITEFNSNEMLNYKISDLFKILKVSSDIDISNIDERADYFLFSKSLKVRFVNIKVLDKAEKKIYFFMEKSHSNLDTKLPFVKRLFEDNIYGMAVFSLPDITLLKANETYISFLDAPYNKKEKCIGRRISEIITGFQGSTSEKLWNTILTTGETCQIDEYMYDRFERGVTYWKATLVPILEDGKPKYCIVMTSEITEQVLLRKNAELQKEQLEAIINSMSDGLIIGEKNLNLTFLNKTAKEFFYNSENIVKIGDLVKYNKFFYDSDGAEIPLDNLPGFRAFNKGKFNDYRLTIVRPDKKIYVSVNGSPIYDDDGKVRAAALCIRDISEKVKYEMELREKGEHLNAIIENMSDALFLINADGSYKYYNNRANELAYHPEIIQNTGDSSIHTKYYDMNGRQLSKDELPSLKVLKGEILDNVILKAVRPDKTLYLSFNGRPVYDHNGNISFAIVCIRDMSDYIKTVLELEESQLRLLKAECEKNAALEKAMEMKDEFLSMISHELRTPLNVISSAIQVMNHVFKVDFSGKAKEYLGMIRQNTNRQLRLVNNLLDITRANAGSININKKNLDIVFLTRVITESVYEFALRKGINIKFESSIEEKIIGIDEDKYERILLNLLSNAIKFTPSGKSIKVKVSIKNGWICVKVADSGIGIPKDRINVIFERFGQVNSSLSRQAEGAGIGLSLVKKFVEALGGNISVNSIEGKGTTFTFTIPAEIVNVEIDKNIMMESLDERLIKITNVEFSDIYL